MPNDELIGKQLANFKIERLLGRGGMAEVYFGRDVSLQRPVAIKLIDARYRGNPDYAERFISEARSIASWRHENIVQVYYAAEEDGLYFFAMEYISGDDLGTLLRTYAVRNELMPHAEVVRIGQAIARALDYAHERGVIHRDVKPANVMISKSERVVLMDFGLALDVQQGSLGEVVGSPHYVAPEQARKSADAVPQSDVYALGVILYEMLTGQVPFDDPSPTTLALQHLSLDPPPPRSLNKNLTPQTEKVLLKALAKKPNKRYQSATALMDALEAALSADTAGASDGGIGRWILGIVALLLMIGGGAFVFTAMMPDDALNESPVTQAAFAAEATTAAPTLADTATPVPATATSVPASATPVPATATTVPASATPVPATATTIPASATPMPATATPVPATATTVPASATSALPNTTPQPTVLYPNGRRIQFLWNDGSFYWYNPTNDSIRMSNIDFEALNAAGEALPYSYDGGRWTQFYSFVEPGNCAAIEIDQRTWLNPAVCNRTNANVYFREGVEQLFWLQANAAQFRVLWNGDEIARCIIANDICEVRIP